MLRTRKRRIAASTILASLLVALLVTPAQGDATSARAEAAAVRQGKALFHKAWRRGGKSCATCHAGGRNKLTAARLKAYPKYDKSWKRVITAQQKMNQMIKNNAGGAVLVLGSSQMNALEAYVSTLR